MSHILRTFMIAAAAALWLGTPAVWAQEDASPQPGMVKLNLPENVDLKVLIDYVSKRSNINFIYDQNTIQRKVTISAPKAVPTDSLMTLLESVLRMNNLALAETNIPDTLRIEAARSLTRIAVDPDSARPTQAATRMFELQHASTNNLETFLKPFLNATQANVATVPGSNLVIITDYAHNMDRIASLIQAIDKPRAAAQFHVVQLEHVKATTVSSQVIQLLNSRVRSTDGRGASSLIVQVDDRTNRLVLVGQDDDIKQAVAFIKMIDVPLGLSTRVYKLQNIAPDRIDRLVGELMDELAKQNYRSVADRDANALIVTATADVHEKVAALALSLDAPREEKQSPIRFYKLQNARAADVLTTLQSIEGNQGLDEVSIDGVNSQKPDSQRDRYEEISGPTPEEVNSRPRFQPASAARTGLTLEDEELGLSRTRVLADEPSNTIIVIARPAMHDVYEKLIRRLDVRRPQVLIEATIVALDTTDGFSLGVEILRAGDVNDKGRYLTFSSFGLSDAVDQSSPGLVLSPGIGFNGAIISANIADVVVRAVRSDSRAQVISKPSILVNDNATGQLVSESEEPFASVNASSTVSTTSFGGFASAGTQIRVTPQISEGDHLKLEYEIELSSFAEASEETDADTASLPPARQTNSLSSEATIPNGYTIIVGGLTRDNIRETVDRIPILGSIPVLEYLFSSRDKTNRQTTLFVFIKATILRDDKFQYLRFVSDQATAKAELDGDYPQSEPAIIQ